MNDSGNEVMEIHSPAAAADADHDADDNDDDGDHDGGDLLKNQMREREPRERECGGSTRIPPTKAKPAAMMAPTALPKS